MAVFRVKSMGAKDLNMVKMRQLNGSIWYDIWFFKNYIKGNILLENNKIIEL